MPYKRCKRQELKKAIYVYTCKHIWPFSVFFFTKNNEMIDFSIKINIIRIIVTKFQMRIKTKVISRKQER
ncbi:hypothetical protein DOZ58_14830 [Acetobacterium sp. KB-1]|nr:hypothetical protein DOZ58_14830 [Acetobacterium sp. KB-1]